MKYLMLPKPTESEFMRIYETIFYFLVEEIEKGNSDVERQLHGLAIMANASSSQITLAASKITEPLSKPTKMDIAVTMAYIKMPVRPLTKYIHHRTYYKYIYSYFDLESQEPRLFNRLPEETVLEIIKLINYIKSSFDKYDIARLGVQYDID